MGTAGAAPRAPRAGEAFATVAKSEPNRISPRARGLALPPHHPAHDREDERERHREAETAIQP